MAKKQRLRSEIPEEYKWNLKDMYESRESFLEEAAKLDCLLEELLTYRGRLTESSEILLEFLDKEKEYSMILNEVYQYAMLRKDENCEDNLSLEDMSLVTNKVVAASEKLSFIEPELLECDFSTIKKFIDSQPTLKEYEFDLEKTFRTKEHILSADKEEMLAGFEGIVGGFEKSYDFITNSEMTFGTFKDEKGEVVELTDSNYRKYMRNPSRRVRKTVQKKYFNKYKEKSLSLAENLMGCYKSENLVAKIRGFKSALDASLFSTNLNEDIYRNLIKTVNQNLDPLRKFYKLVKKVIEVNKLSDYDLGVSLVDDNKTYTIKEAKDTIVTGLGIMGHEYQNMLKEAFGNNWIDVYNNKGKCAGFYCTFNYRVHPYILANYEEKFYDVSSLAHELGHALHNCYSAQNNTFTYFESTIFLAEVASLTNELILSRYILDHSQDKNEKLVIINHLLSLYNGNLFSATKGANFEMLLHEKLQNNESVTSESISDLWANLTREYYKNIVELSPESRYAWASVPHFYYNYYYFQYATGISMATYIANRICNGDKEFLEKYISFLKLGSSKYSLDAVATLGIDMTKPEVIKEAIDYYDSLVDLFESIYES